MTPSQEEMKEFYLNGVRDSYKQGLQDALDLINVTIATMDDRSDLPVDTVLQIIRSSLRSLIEPKSR